MHYKNGQKAKLGDLITWWTNGVVQRFGFVQNYVEGAKTCDLYVDPIATKTTRDGVSYVARMPPAAYAEVVTASECLPLVEIQTNEQYGTNITPDLAREDRPAAEH